MLKNTIAIALAAVTLATAPVHAADNNQRSVSVRHADLDLASEAGQRELDNRINDAARKVCGMDERPTGSNIASRGSRECYETTRTQIARQVATLVEREENRLGG